jgi:hypothetical protein
MTDSTLETLRELRRVIPKEQQEEFLKNLPTEPASYRMLGNVWILGADGRWTDSTGVSYDPKYNFVLGWNIRRSDFVKLDM